MVKKKKLSRNAIIGYPAGIITGVTYGLNPLFGKPLMDAGASIDTILFYRYFFAVVLLGGFLLLTKQSFKVTAKQAGVLLVLGVLYTMSSTTLIELSIQRLRIPVNFAMCSPPFPFVFQALTAPTCTRSPRPL